MYIFFISVLVCGFFFNMFSAIFNLNVGKGFRRLLSMVVGSVSAAVESWDVVQRVE